ncbi:MAG: hypothetical protein QXS24_05390 [Desulfurococcaceae archaeon]
MIAKSDLKITEVYELFGELRYRVCVKGTNIVVNVKALNDDEALNKAIEVLIQAGLDAESLDKLRKLVGEKAKC